MNFHCARKHNNTRKCVTSFWIYFESIGINRCIDITCLSICTSHMSIIYKKSMICVIVNLWYIWLMLKILALFGENLLFVSICSFIIQPFKHFPFLWLEIIFQINQVLYHERTIPLFNPYMFWFLQALSNSFPISLTCMICKETRNIAWRGNTLRVRCICNTFLHQFPDYLRHCVGSLRTGVDI